MQIEARATHTYTIMANRRANPFSISSLLEKKDNEKPEEKFTNVKEEEPRHDNLEDECSKDVKPALERIPSMTEDSKQRRIHSWFTEYQARQTSIEASKYIHAILLIVSLYSTLHLSKIFKNSRLLPLCSHIQRVGDCKYKSWVQNYTKARILVESYSTIALSLYILQKWPLSHL